MRGVKLAVIVICVGLTFGALGTMGWFGWVGVHPQPGVDTEQERKNLEEVNGSSSGGASDFGIVRTATDTFNALRNVVGEVGSGLVSLGMPPPLAYAVEAIVSVSIGIAVLYLVRGVVGR
jgi:hypothetical protein